ncbi:MAG: hypothetical protein OXR67_01445 [Chloroflexota bacterium]|nr:hypothetical protein [Chloroflexota bacterium]
MQMYPELFHQHRLRVPYRLAERRVFQALAHSGAPGFAYYEWQRSRRNRPALQLDFAIWLENIGRFGLQIKGGHHVLEGGIWRRQKGRRGDYEEVTGCPLAITADATMSLLKEVAQALDQSTFFISVLVFPDMNPDDAIISKVQSSNVHLVWGADRLVERLAEIAREVGVLRPPDADDIRLEVDIITDGQVGYGGVPPGIGVGRDAVDEPAFCDCPTTRITDYAGPDLLILYLGRVRVVLVQDCGNTT